MTNFCLLVQLFLYFISQRFLLNGQLFAEPEMVLSLEGKLVKAILAAESETKIDLYELHSGVYLVKIGDRQKEDHHEVNNRVIYH